MRLQDIFTPENIFLDLRSREKNAVLRELADRMIRSYGFSRDEGILKAVLEREEKMSTGIQKGIAIPHGKSDAVRGVAGVIGLSENGVDYDSLDGEPVHLLFFIVSCGDAADAHLEVLKKIEEALESRESRAVFELIVRYEERITA